MDITAFHAKYFAHDLTRRCASDSVEKLASVLSDAQVDLNPHQIEAALFAFRNPFSRGAILADEVGLGKTIEAGLLLAQKWAERKRRLLVIVPANLRKQWSQELTDKFHLPSVILENRSFNNTIRAGNLNPFQQDAIVLLLVPVCPQDRAVSATDPMGLERELEAEIAEGQRDAREKLLNNFDQEVVEKVRIQSHDYLDRFNARLWLLTRYLLAPYARFEEQAYSFMLEHNPFPGETIHPGPYRMSRNCWTRLPAKTASGSTPRWTSSIVGPRTAGPRSRWS